MLNQIVLVGKLVNEPTVKELESGKKVCTITLAVQRSYKNMNGEYDKDEIEVVVWDALTDNLAKFCHTGDVIGIKGRLQVRGIKMEIVAEKVTFLSSARKED